MSQVQKYLMGLNPFIWIVAILLLIATWFSSYHAAHFKGYFQTAKPTTGGVNILFDQYLSPENGVVTMDVYVDGVSAANPVSGFNLSIGGLTTLGAITPTVTKGALMTDLQTNSGWIFQAGTSDPLVGSGIGTTSLTTNGHVFTLTFSVPTSFTAGVFTVDADVVYPDSTQESIDQTNVTVKPAFTSIDMTGTLTETNGIYTIAVGLNNLTAATAISGLDVEFIGIPAGSTSIAMTPSTAQTSAGWIGVPNVARTNPLGTYVGATAIGSATITSVDMLTITFSSTTAPTEDIIIHGVVTVGGDMNILTPVTIDVSGSESTTLDTDINEDGVTNLLDFTCMMIGWRTDPTNPPRADINADGSVQITDFGALLGEFDSSTSPVTSTSGCGTGYVE